MNRQSKKSKKKKEIKLKKDNYEVKILQDTKKRFYFKSVGGYDIIHNCKYVGIC